MAHFAQLDANNVVTQVIVVSDIDTSDAIGQEKEHIGAAFCEKLFGGTWKKTSYNTRAGVYYLAHGEVGYDQSKALRKNYAGIGFTYDEQRDAFIPPKVYASWVLDETTCNWKAPVDMPTDGKQYSWNEETQSWDEVVA
jgi:hypothetical protein